MTLEIGKNTKMCTKCKQLPEQCACKENFHRWITEEVLNECLHYVGHFSSRTNTDVICNKCGMYYDYYEDTKEQRTFDNWPDYGAVVEGLRDKDLLDNFTAFILYDIEELPIDVYTDKGLFFTTLQEWWEREIKK